jgi:hypothetical protein
MPNREKNKIAGLDAGRCCSGAAILAHIFELKVLSQMSLAVVSDLRQDSSSVLAAILDSMTNRVRPSILHSY